MTLTKHYGREILITRIEYTARTLNRDQFKHGQHGCIVAGWCVTAYSTESININYYL